MADHNYVVDEKHTGGDNKHFPDMKNHELAGYLKIRGIPCYRKNKNEKQILAQIVDIKCLPALSLLEEEILTIERERQDLLIL